MPRGADSFFEGDEPEPSPRRDDDLASDSFFAEFERYGEDPDSLRGVSRGDSGNVLVEGDWEEQADAPAEDLFYEVGRLVTDLLGILDNRPFDQDELAQIREQLDSLRSGLRDVRRENREQAGAIMARLDDMRDSSERLGRKDWALLAIGAGASLVIAGVVPPLVMLHVGAKALHGLVHLFDAGGSP